MVRDVFNVKYTKNDQVIESIVRVSCYNYINTVKVRNCRSMSVLNSDHALSRCYSAILPRLHRGPFPTNQLTAIKCNFVSCTVCHFCCICIFLYLALRWGLFRVVVSWWSGNSALNSAVHIQFWLIVIFFAFSAELLDCLLYFKNQNVFGLLRFDSYLACKHFKSLPSLAPWLPY